MRTQKAAKVCECKLSHYCIDDSHHGRSKHSLLGFYDLTQGFRYTHELQAVQGRGRDNVEIKFFYGVEVRLEGWLVVLSAPSKGLLIICTINQSGSF